MFLADDIVLFPFKGLLKIFKEIHKAALEEIEGEAQSIRDQLADLYKMLEEGAVTEEEFDAQESVLLDRLDEIDDRDGSIELGDVDDDDADPEWEGDDDDDEVEDDEDDEDDEPGLPEYQYLTSEDDADAGDGLDLG